MLGDATNTLFIQPSLRGGSHNELGRVVKRRDSQRCDGRLRVAVGLAVAALSGCMADPSDARPKVPGDIIGTFHVEAVLTSSTCGQGDLSAPGLAAFDVIFSKDTKCLYWNNGADSICGSYSSNQKTFSFTSEFPTTFLQPGPRHPGCVIWRQDSASGKWDNEGSDGEEFRAFTGRLSYAFAAGTGSQCDGVFDTSSATILPCAQHYEMTADRTDE